MAAQTQKQSIVLAYTGDGKGKTSAGIGLVARSLGNGDRVAFVQFIKAWHVSEHAFFDAIKPVFPDRFVVYLGGRGFYNAGNLSAKEVTEAEHRQAARDALAVATTHTQSGQYDLVVCDEINNAVADGLLSVNQLRHLILDRHPATSLCITGRNAPGELMPHIDIATSMEKIRHHYDDGFLAMKGLDY